MSPLTVVTVVPFEADITSVKMEKATGKVNYGPLKTTLRSAKDLASELEEERRVIMEIQKSIQKVYPTQAMLDAAKVHPTSEEKAEADGRSIYVGHVDYAVKDAELLLHFKGCGEISRVSIQRDKFSGRPKGFAYVEFASKEAVELALALNESFLKGRKIKVSAKRTNLPYHAIQHQQGQPGKIRPQMNKYAAVPYRHRNMSIDRRRPVPY